MVSLKNIDNSTTIEIEYSDFSLEYGTPVLLFKPEFLETESIQITIQSPGMKQREKGLSYLHRKWCLMPQAKICMKVKKDEGRKMKPILL